MKTILSIFAIILLQSCSDTNTEFDSGSQIDNGNTNPAPNPSAQWSIPVNEVLDGGPGKDGIPALVNPEMVPVSEISYLQDSDLLLAFKLGDDIRAYPHAILDWHEIINDNIGVVSVAVTYCPLTGTGIGWDRVIGGAETTFGVSGLLYNTNLIPYDRATDSNWSQILNESVNGPLRGQQADLIPLFETDWATWKQMYPDSKVVSTNTGFSRTYGITPYGDYNTNNERFLFPVPKDNRLPSKERVLAIVDRGDALAFRFEHFSESSIIEDSFKGKTYILAGNPHFMVAFEKEGPSADLQFEYIWDGSSERLLRDNQGNIWNVFGQAVAGPRTGEVLTPANAFMGFWFSIPAFYSTVIWQPS